MKYAGIAYMTHMATGSMNYVATESSTPTATGNMKFEATAFTTPLGTGWGRIIKRAVQEAMVSVIE